MSKHGHNILAIFAVEHLNSSILSNQEVKQMCQDQYTKQMYAFERSKVTSMAKIERDIAIAYKARVVNKLNEYAGNPRSTTADRM